MKRLRRLLIFGLALVIVMLMPVVLAYRQAIADPIVRHTDVKLLSSERAGPGIRIVMLSDIHVGGPDMPPGRVGRIVTQVNRLHPDLVLIAGDLVSDKLVSTRRYSVEEAIAPLARLRARLGTMAVLGNHDHWRDAAAIRATLIGSGVTVLDNDVARAGPLAIGGLDDAFTGHADLPATLAALRRAGGIPVLLSHSPDPFPQVPGDVRLMLAGHTHCGQIRLPVIGAIATMSAYGDRYACGVVREGGKTLIVGAGIGTSILPLRLGAVPDLWAVTIR